MACSIRVGQAFFILIFEVLLAQNLFFLYQLYQVYAGNKTIKRLQKIKIAEK